jgi:hypothetical protein
MPGCFLTSNVRAADEQTNWLDRLELSGWLEGIQSMRIRSPNDSLTSRASLHVELSADLDWL